MARETIFDIMKTSTKLIDDLHRLKRIFETEKTISMRFHSPTKSLKHMTMYDYICDYGFAGWKQRGHFVDFQDFLDSINFNIFFIDATEAKAVSSILFVIEFYYNIWMISKRAYCGHEGNFDLMKTIMDDCLAELNHKAYHVEKEEKTIVIEDNPAVTAVAEIVKPEMAIELIRYNHFLLKGNIKEKQRILKIIADALEARQAELNSIDHSFKSDLFNLINSINIRHSNTEPSSSYYHEFVAKMSDEELENWYDETYQMMLLAFLRLDNVERSQKVKELMRNIHGE